MERRTKRSANREEALQYLLEALAERSQVSTLLLTDAQGGIVAGMGEPSEIRGVARLAGPVTRGEPCDEFERVTEGTDWMSRRVQVESATYYLAALGSRLSHVPEAVHGIARILEGSCAAA
jgi:hypothetical protein